MYEETNKGEKWNNEDNNLTEFMTENNFYVKMNLNELKDKIIFNACVEEIGNIFYYKEYTYEELSQLTPILKKESNIEKMYKTISKSIYYNPVTSRISNTNNSLNLIIPLIFEFNNEKGTKKTTFELDEIIRSKEEIINILTEKVNFLIKEKNNYLKGYKVKKLIDGNKEEKIMSRINLLEKNIDLLEKKSKIFINSNLLSCSNIINTPEDWQIIIERLKKIDPIYNNIILKLVYRATRDGDSAQDFHKKCDQIGPNITLVLTLNNRRFGGFTKNNWEHLKEDIKEKEPEVGSGKSDVDAFCFSVDLNKIYNNNELDSGVIFCCNSYGPTFCRNIFAINGNMLTKGGYCLKKNFSCFEGQEVDYEISGGKKVFGIKELEVLEILFV